MILQEVLTILSKKIACTRSTTVAIFLNHFILKAEKRDSISKLTNGISTEVLNCELKVSKPATRSKTEVSEVLQVLTGQSTTTTMKSADIHSLQNQEELSDSLSTNFTWRNQVIVFTTRLRSWAENIAVNWETEMHRTTFC